jgi:hypothetical protein
LWQRRSPGRHPRAAWHLERLLLALVMALHPKEFDIEWRKSRVAARLLIAASQGRLSPRRRELAGRLAKDKAVENRLINQALAGFYAHRPHRVPLD